MGKRLKDYLLHLAGIDFVSLGDAEREALERDLLNQIAFFQHERIVHLIVTMTVGLALLVVCIWCFSSPTLFGTVLAFLLLVLFVPYIFHYYRLENGVQRLYSFYDICAGNPAYHVGAGEKSGTGRS